MAMKNDHPNRRYFISWILTPHAPSPLIVDTDLFSQPLRPQIAPRLLSDVLKTPLAVSNAEEFKRWYESLRMCQCRRRGRPTSVVPANYNHIIPAEDRTGSELNIQCQYQYSFCFLKYPQRSSGCGLNNQVLSESTACIKVFSGYPSIETRDFSEAELWFSYSLGFATRLPHLSFAVFNRQKSEILTKIIA